jgi:nitroimidazol reductase NimA-like FMN-containing flavoprotein (pyridoxamine 5'-phosphate oxidase superfamily)
MTEFRGVWSESDVEAFLRDVTVPIRIATHRPDGSLWMVALWYRYRDGGFECATSAGADLVAFLRSSPEVAVDVSTNRPPYRGVRGNGVASLAPDEDKRLLRALLERYLGGTDSELAGTLLDGDREELRIRIEPDELYSWDFTGQMPAVDPGSADEE